MTTRQFTRKKLTDFWNPKILTAFGKLTSLLNENIGWWNSHEHNFGIEPMIRIKWIIHCVWEQRRLDLIFVEDMKSGCILNFESIVNREGFHPRMVSHEKIRWYIHIVIAFLQVIHTTVWEVQGDFWHWDVVPEIIEKFVKIYWYLIDRKNLAKKS